VKENLEGLKEQLEIAKIEKGLGFLTENDRIKLIRNVKRDWGEKGVYIISNLTLDNGVRDLDLARVCGMPPREVRKILYELKDRAIIAYIREETLELLEYYYYLNPDGIENFLAAGKEVKEEKVEEAKYPFPEEFSIYQRRRLYSEVG
jgi:transcription initiation factor IIE alpha subunit